MAANRSEYDAYWSRIRRNVITAKGRITRPCNPKNLETWPLAQAFGWYHEKPYETKKE